MCAFYGPEDAQGVALLLFVLLNLVLDQAPFVFAIGFFEYLYHASLVAASLPTARLARPRQARQPILTVNVSVHFRLLELMLVRHLLELLPKLIFFPWFWLASDVIGIEHLWFSDVVEDVIGLFKSVVATDCFFGDNHFARRVYIVPELPWIVIQVAVQVKHIEVSVTGLEQYLVRCVCH